MIFAVKKKSKIIYNDNKPYDHSFSSMIPTFIVLFMIFFPINYIIELFTKHILLIVGITIILSVICYKIFTIFYNELFEKFELRRENNSIITILYMLYSICCYIGYIYYNLSVDNMVSEALMQNELEFLTKVILLIITGYLPLRIIPLLISTQSTLIEKIINILVVLVYLVKKII
jgi:hypothetical protein